MSRLQRLSVSRIKVGERHRRDLGDIDALAASIEAVGLLHPVVVDVRHRLVAGQRRLAAWKKVRRGEEIPAYIVTGLDDALTASAAERDENTCRKDLVPSEAVSQADAYEALEREEAKKRQREHGGTGPGRPKNTSANLAEVSGETREKVAEAVGVGHTTLAKAREVVRATTDRSAPKEVRAVAREALLEMDATGRVDPAYRSVVEAKREAVGAGMSQADKRLLLKQNASRLSNQAFNGLFALDATRVASVIPEDEWPLWEASAKQAKEWFSEMLAARPRGLKAVQ